MTKAKVLPLPGHGTAWHSCGMPSAEVNPKSLTATKKQHQSDQATLEASALTQSWLLEMLSPRFHQFLTWSFCGFYMDQVL